MLKQSRRVPNSNDTIRAFQDGRPTQFEDTASRARLARGAPQRAINEVRAFLLERGMAVRKGRRYLLAQYVPLVLEAAEQALLPRIIKILVSLVRVAITGSPSGRSALRRAREFAA